MKKQIEHYFKSYPESEKCFVTSNEMIFHAEHDAKAHADTLPDKKVAEFKRDFANYKEEEVKEVKETKEAKAPKETKSDKEKETKEFVPAGNDEHKGKDTK